MRPNAPHNKQANQAVKFINQLTLTDDFNGEQFGLYPEQEHFVRWLTGAPIQRALFASGRKSGKTTLICGVLLYFLLCRAKRGQCVISASVTREKAAEIFDKLKEIIERDEQLAAMVDITASDYRIDVKGMDSYFLAISSDPKNSLKNPSCIVIDEFHEFDSARLLKFYNRLTTGDVARRNAVQIHLMNAGKDKTSLPYKEFEFAQRVQAFDIDPTDPNGVDDPTYLAAVYACDPMDNPADESCWSKALPLARHVPFIMENIRQKYKRMKEQPGGLQEFQQWYLCQWQMQSSLWLNEQIIQRNANPVLDEADTIYTAGLDIAVASDTSSLVLFGRNKDGTFDVRPHVFVCEAQVKRRKGAEFNYELWAGKGLLTVTEGEIQTSDDLFAEFLAILQKHNVLKIGVDRWGAATIASRLIDNGYDTVQIKQNYEGHTDPIRFLHQQMTLGKLRFGKPVHEVMRWMLSNAAVKPNSSGGMYISKGESHRGRIDAVSALLNAAAVFLEADNDQNSELHTGADLDAYRCSWV